MTNPAGGRPGQIPGARFDYAEITRSVQLKRPAGSVFATGSVSVGPDTGQYWYPTLIRVGTRSQTVPFAACTVYLGANTVTDFTTYLDDTLFGQNDTTSICSGAMLPRGQAITAVWGNGQDGDIAVITIFTIVTNVPLSLGNQVPLPPGARFTGHDPSVSVYSLLIDNVGQSIPVGQESNTGIFDMREFTSFQIAFNTAASAISAPTGFNPIQIQVFWPQTQNFSTSTPIYCSLYEIMAAGDNTHGFFVNRSGAFIQDQCHGPYMFVQIVNAGVNTLPGYQLGIFASQKPYGSSYVSGYHGTLVGLAIDQGPDGTIISETISNLAAGASQSRSSYIAGGNIQLVYTTAGQPGSFTTQNGSDTNSQDTITVAANTTTRPQIVFPNRAIGFTITNTGAAPANYNVRAYRQLANNL